MRALLSAIIFGSAAIFSAHGGERYDKVNGEREALAESELWFYNDLDKGFAEAKLGELRYEPLEIAEGDFAADPADPVKTSDGRLHFAIKKGDVLLNVSPPKGDFVLLQLRKGDGGWQVVSEYLD